MHIYIFDKTKDDPYVRDMFTLDHDLDMLQEIENLGYAHGRWSNDLIYINIDYDGVKTSIYDQVYDEYYMDHMLKEFISKLN